MPGKGPLFLQPAGKTVYLVAWQSGAAGGNKDARFILRATSSTEGVLIAGVFLDKDVIIVEDGALNVPIMMPIKIPAQTDIKISVVSAAQTAKCAGHFMGWYES